MLDKILPTKSNEVYTNSLLIVADDFGYGLERNNSIIDCFLKKAISCTSLLVNCKHTESGVELLKQHKLPSGLHFNLTEGLPVSDPKEIASLVTGDGHFMGKENFWNNENINPEHVRVELVAQLKRYKHLLGEFPFRVDGHQHVHVHPQVCLVFARILQEYDVTEARLPLEYDMTSAEHSAERNQFHARIYKLATQAKIIFERFQLVFADVFLGMNFMGRLMEGEKITKVLEEIFVRHETCELMTHPGKICDLTSDGFIGDVTSDEFSRSVERVHEADVLTSEHLIKFYQSKSIQIVK